MRFPVALAGWASLIVASSCGGAEREAKAQADAVVRAVAALRGAPNEAKARLLPALAQARCKDLEVCELKRVCLSAYEGHVRALEMTSRVKSRLDAAASAGEASELAGVLSEAERELGRSQTLSDQCADAEGAVRRRFKL